MRAVLSSLALTALAAASLLATSPAGAVIGNEACTSDLQCPDGEICSLGECLPGCRSDDDCYEGEVCDAELATCVAATPEELVEQACPCDADWKNHGQYVICVVFEVDALELEADVADDIVSQAAQSDCGK